MKTRCGNMIVLVRSEKCFALMSPRQQSWINVNGLCVSDVITDSEHQVVLLHPDLDSFNIF